MPLLIPAGQSGGTTNTIIVSSSIITTDTVVISSSVITTNNYSGTGFATASLLISAASLSGGMQLVAATGTLPQRLTMADNAYITGAYGDDHATGLCPDPDGVHFWTTRFTAASQIRRYRISDGVIDYVITGSTTDADKNKHLTASTFGLTSSPNTNGRLWACISNAGAVAMIDPTSSPPSCEVFTLSGFAGNYLFAIEHVPGRILVRSTGSLGLYVEYAYSGTGSANACVYTGLRTTSNSTYELLADASGSVYKLEATTLAKMPATTLTASATITAINATYLSTPGYGNAWNVMSYHPQANRIYVKNLGAVTDGSDVFAVNLTTFAVEERVFGPVEFGNPLFQRSAGGWIRQSIAYTPDGSQAVFGTHDRNPTNLTTFTNAMVIRLNPQRARWTWTPGFAALVTFIGFSGMMNNDKGFLPYPAGNAWFQSERDKRWTKFYYSLDGGATRTEFVNSDELSISVSSAQTLTVDCEMQTKLNNMNGTLPYIGDSNGNAATIFYKVVT